MRSNTIAARKERDRRLDRMALAVLILLTLVVIFPIYWIFRSSLISSLVSLRTFTRIMRLWRMTSTEMQVPR